MRSGILFMILLLGGILFLSVRVSAKVLLSEIMVRGMASSTDEFVEFYNNTDTTSSIHGWELQKKTASGAQKCNLVSSFADVFIRPFSYFLIAHRDYVFNGVAPDATYDNESCSLSNDNSLFLLDHGIPVDVVNWGNIVGMEGKTASNTSNGKSLIRKPNNENGNGEDTDNDVVDFMVNNSDPQNSFSSSRPLWPLPEAPDEDPTDETPTSTFDNFAWSQIKINEIMVDPGSGENEWVELYNSATTSIDLTGGILCDSKDSSCKIGSSTSTIEAGGYVVLTWNSSELNNSGDKVIWKNPEGVVMDEMQYGEGFWPIASDGNSLARDAGDNWIITTMPTPGAVNNIVDPVAQVVNSGGGGGGGGSSVNNTNNTTEAKIKTVTTKTTTSTVKIKEDPVKVVWKIKPPTQGSPNESLFFDVSDSADPRGGLLRFFWNFGDGASGAGEKIEHSYASSGVFVVLASASSTAGTVGSKKLTVRIASGLSTKNVGIKISEVMVNPEGADKKEFIKIFNISSSTADLSGWKLIYKDKEYIFPDKTNIIGNSSLVFYQAVTHFMLENSGGKIELLTPDDNIADMMSYGKAISGQSFTATSTAQVLGVKITADTAQKTVVKSTSGVKYFYGGSMSLSEARLANKNTTVKIRGTVVVLPKVFGAQYFYITDGTTGMQIYQNKKMFPDLKIGDIIEVAGVTSATGEIKRVNVKNKADMRVLSAGTSSSTSVVIEDLDEEMLGGLLKIAGEITEIKSNFMYVDDGNTEAVVYFKQGAKIDRKKFKEGDLVEVEGVLEKSKTGLQIWPRGQEDVLVVGQSEDLLNKTESTNSGTNNLLQTYLIVTAGGITVLALGALIKAYIQKNA